MGNNKNLISISSRRWVAHWFREKQKKKKNHVPRFPPFSKLFPETSNFPKNNKQDDFISFFPFFKPRHPFRPDVRLAAQPKHYGATTTWIKTVKTNAETPQDGQQKLERDVGCAQRTEAGHHHLNC